MPFATITIAGIATRGGEIRNHNGTAWGSFIVSVPQDYGRVPASIDYKISMRCYRPELEEEVLRVKEGHFCSVSGDYEYKTFERKDGTISNSHEIRANHIESVPIVIAVSPDSDGYDPFANEDE